MIKASEKTKARLAKRLRRFGIEYSNIMGEWMFTETVRVCIPTGFGVRFVTRTEYPVQPMFDNGHYSDVLSGKISRLARAAKLESLMTQSMMSKKALTDKAMEASGEFVEFLNHIRNPRVQVV